MMNSAKRAAALAEALPYLRDYHNQIVVVKYGGNAMIDDQLKKAVIEDVLMLHLVGIHVVLVHGGGPDISRMLKTSGIESRFINGLRYTDEATMDIVQMVLCGKVNKELVGLLEGKGIGIGGMDGGLFQAVRLEENGVDYGYVGDIRKVNSKIIESMIEEGYIPVVSSVALGLEDGHAYNINADTAASKLASALKAKKLLLLTDIAGLLANPADPTSLISHLKVSQVPNLLAQGIVGGGMIPKVDCCVEAVRQGVQSASIIDGRVPHSILIELLTNEGIGTMFSQEDPYEL